MLKKNQMKLHHSYSDNIAIVIGNLSIYCDMNESTFFNES